MLIGIITFIICWIIFLCFSDKAKLPLYVQTISISIIIALITDLLMIIYPLWNYPGTDVEAFFIALMNSFGIYFVVTYFFLQSLPKPKTTFTIIRHIFYWSLLAITLEFISLNIGYIEHGLWWNLAYSYIADWILFALFFFHHIWTSNFSILNEH